MTGPILSRPARRLARASAALVSANVLRAGLGFAQSLVVGRALGSVNFGRLTFCMAWAGWLTFLCDLGLSELLTRDSARSRDDAHRLLVTAVATKLILLAPLGALVCVFAGQLATDAETVAALRVGVLLAAVGVVYGCFAAVFRAFEWMVTLLWIEGCGLTLQLLGSLWLVRTRGSILSFLALATGVQIVQLATALVLWRPRFPEQTLAAWSRSIVPLLRRSLPFAGAGVFANTQARWSPLALGYLSRPAEVGWFGAAWRFSEMAKLVPYGVFGAAIPVLSSNAEDGLPLRNGLAPMFDRALLVLAVGIAAVLVAASTPLVRHTFGEDFRPAARTLVWLSLALVPTLTNSGRKVHLYAMGREDRVLRMTAISAGLQMAASLPLISAFGAQGAALSLLIGEAAIWIPLRRQV